MSDNSLNKVRRAQDQLHKLVDGKVLSPSGYDFLISALDPMHDLQLKNLQGWPDLETAPSVVRCVKQSLTIKAPIDITGNWDCLIANWPWMDNKQFRLMTHNNNTIGSAASGGSFPLGGVQAWYNASGVPMTISSGSIGQVLLPDGYATGMSRIVGQGIEVINSTAEIYKQGQVTVFRLPQPTRAPQTLSYCKDLGTAITPQPISAVPVRFPPQSQAEAMILSGSRQWKASEGCYLVTAFSGEVNPATMVEYVQPMMSDTDPAIDPNDQTAVFFPDKSGASIVNPACLMWKGTKLYPLHTSGAFFTGLSKETTLTITVNTYVETFPAPDDVLAPLARPSAEYDPEALKVFSHALNSLPVGVPADMNGFGDWFAGVVSKVADWVSPALSAIPHPLAQGLSFGARAAKTLADDYLAANSPQSRPRLKAPPTQAKQPAGKGKKKPGTKTRAAK